MSRSSPSSVHHNPITISENQAREGLDVTVILLLTDVCGLNSKVGDETNVLDGGSTYDHL